MVAFVITNSNLVVHSRYDIVGRAGISLSFAIARWYQYRHICARKHRDGQRRYRFPGQLQRRPYGNDIVLTVITGGASPRAGHMDRRCACDRWARFHAAPQTAEVNSVQSIVTRESFRS